MSKLLNRNKSTMKDAEVFDGAFFTYKSNLYIPTEVQTANDLTFLFCSFICEKTTSKQIGRHSRLRARITTSLHGENG